MKYQVNHKINRDVSVKLWKIENQNTKWDDEVTKVFIIKIQYG